MSLPTTPTPITRIVAKHLARALQKKAKAERRKLSYTQALAEVAKQCGYANVHQMTASYLDEKTVPAELADLGANPFADVLTRGKGGIVLISREPGSGALNRIQDHYPAGRCVELQATVIDSFDLKYDTRLHDQLRNAEAVVIDEIDCAPKHIAKPFLTEIVSGKIAGIQLREGATIILTTFGPAPHLLAYLKDAKKVVSLSKEPIRNFNISEMTRFLVVNPAGAPKAVIPDLPDFRAHVSGSWGRLQAIVLHAHRVTRGKPVGAFTASVNNLVQNCLLDSALDPMDDGVAATVEFLRAPGTEDVIEVVNRAIDMLVEAQIPLEQRLRSKMHALGDALSDMARMTGGENKQNKDRPFADMFHPTASELVNYFEHRADGSPHYPLSDWTYEVTNGDTRLGYWDWLAGCYERDDRSPLEPEAPQTLSERMRIPGVPTHRLEAVALDPHNLRGLPSSDLGYDGPVRLELGEPGVNTVIDYQYRDASNYKTSARAIFNGRLTPAEIVAILGKLEDEENFIPGQVGLDDLQDSSAGCASYWDPDQDHPWHEMLEIGYTDGAPNVAMTARDFLSAVQSVTWDENYRPSFAAEMDKRYQEKLKRDAEQE